VKAVVPFTEMVASRESKKSKNERIYLVFVFKKFGSVISK